jgi:hypothetical protein
LWEAFLLQMNEFDRFLERNLRRMLDPVVEAPPPARGRRKPVLAVIPPAIGPTVEPVPVTVPVTPLV